MNHEARGIDRNSADFHFTALKYQGIVPIPAGDDDRDVGQDEAACLERSKHYRSLEGTILRQALSALSCRDGLARYESIKLPVPYHGKSVVRHSLEVRKSESVCERKPVQLHSVSQLVSYEDTVPLLEPL